MRLLRQIPGIERGLAQRAMAAPFVLPQREGCFMERRHPNQHRLSYRCNHEQLSVDLQATIAVLHASALRAIAINKRIDNRWGRRRVTTVLGIRISIVCLVLTRLWHTVPLTPTEGRTYPSDVLHFKMLTILAGCSVSYRVAELCHCSRCHFVFF